MGAGLGAAGAGLKVAAHLVPTEQRWIERGLACAGQLPDAGWTTAHGTGPAPDRSVRGLCRFSPGGPYGVYTVGLGAVGMLAPMKKLVCGGWL